MGNYLQKEVKANCFQRKCEKEAKDIDNKFLIIYSHFTIKSHKAK